MRLPSYIRSNVMRAAYAAPRLATPSFDELQTALRHRRPIDIGLYRGVTLSAIELEDGSGRSWNVTFYVPHGGKMTVHTRTTD